MFDIFAGWEECPDYPTLFRADRPVRVEMGRVLPPSGRRQDEIPMAIKAGGLRVEPWMEARQVASVRRACGGWLAVVLVPAGSANGRSAVTMQLWVPPEVITTDLTVGGEMPGAHRGSRDETRPR